MFKNIVFWLEYPLFHVAPLIESVAAKGVDVIVVCEKHTPQWRLDMGFPTPCFGEAQALPPMAIKSLIKQSQKHFVLFSAWLMLTVIFIQNLFLGSQGVNL